MWFKVSDDLAFHPKAVKAGDAAMGAWVRMGAWCGFARSGGRIPNDVALAITGDNASGKAKLVALKCAGFLSRDGDDWVFNDWDTYNPTAEEAASLHKKRSDAGKLGARKRWKSKAQAKASAIADDVADDVAKGSGTGTGRSKKKSPARSRPKNWKPNETAQRFAGEHQLGVTWEANSFREWTDRDGRIFVDWDAGFLNHLRRRAEDRARRGVTSGTPAASLPEPASRTASSALPPQNPGAADGA